MIEVRLGKRSPLPVSRIANVVGVLSITTLAAKQTIAAGSDSNRFRQEAEGRAGNAISITIKRYKERPVARELTKETRDVPEVVSLLVHEERAGNQLIPLFANSSEPGECFCREEFKSMLCNNIFDLHGTLQPFVSRIFPNFNYRSNPFVAISVKLQ